MKGFFTNPLSLALLLSTICAHTISASDWSLSAPASPRSVTHESQDPSLAFELIAAEPSLTGESIPPSPNLSLERSESPPIPPSIPLRTIRFSKSMPSHDSPPSTTPVAPTSPEEAEHRRFPVTPHPVVSAITVHIAHLADSSPSSSSSAESSQEGRSPSDSTADFFAIQPARMTPLHVEITHSDLTEDGVPESTHADSSEEDIETSQTKEASPLPIMPLATDEIIGLTESNKKTFAASKPNCFLSCWRSLITRCRRGSGKPAGPFHAHPDTEDGI